LLQLLCRANFERQVFAMNERISESSRFAQNSSEVAVKVIDGEGVAINVLTGKYHGMSGSACRITKLISNGYNLGQVLDSIETSHADSRERLRSDLFDFVAQLLEQGILIPRTADTSPVPEGTPQWDEAEYSAPQLETYDDMAELLALDPPMPTVLDTPWSQSA
jgi:Coenzyme PQQ synthesis protein D (PqqD)